MHFRITGDTDISSGVSAVAIEISGPTRRHFLQNDYGGGLQGIVVVLMCQEPALNLERRVRHSEKDKKLYIDIMLDLNQMRELSPQARKSVVLERLGLELPELLEKFKFLHFDRARFVHDLRAWLATLRENMVTRGLEGRLPNRDPC